MYISIPKSLCLCLNQHDQQGEKVTGETERYEKKGLIAWVNIWRFSTQTNLQKEPELPLGLHRAQVTLVFKTKPCEVLKPAASFLQGPKSNHSDYPKPTCFCLYTAALLLDQMHCFQYDNKFVFFNIRKYWEDRRGAHRRFCKKIPEKHVWQHEPFCQSTSPDKKQIQVL